MVGRWNVLLGWFLFRGHVNFRGSSSDVSHQQYPPQKNSHVAWSFQEILPTAMKRSPNIWSTSGVLGVIYLPYPLNTTWCEAVWRRRKFQRLEELLRNCGFLDTSNLGSVCSYWNKTTPKSWSKCVEGFSSWFPQVPKRLEINGGWAACFVTSGVFAWPFSSLLWIRPSFFNAWNFSPSEGSATVWWFGGFSVSTRLPLEVQTAQHFFRPPWEIEP